MSPLTEVQVARLARLLEERERMLSDEIRVQLQQAEEPQRIDLAGLVRDEAEEAVGGMAADPALIQRDVAELREVEAAVARLRAGNYGACTSCGADIAYERLVAQPAARHCLACDSEREKLYAHGAAPAR